MRLPPLNTIREMREKQGLTQTELAKKSGVSQSLIARLEAGTVDPRYSKVEKILAALEKTKKQEPNAKEIMTKKVVGVEVDDTIEQAAAKMKKHNVSQLPVLKNGKPVGSISEKLIIEEIAKGADTKNLSKSLVIEHMEPQFPTVNPTTTLSVLTALLEHGNAVIIQEKEEVVGIITNSDLLKMIHK